MSDVLNASMGALWLQRTPGKAPEYVGCVDLDDISAPQGDSTLSLCRDANGNYKTVGRSRGAPGATTTSFTAWVYPEKSILDDIVKSNCPINLFALSRTCGRADVFDNYVRGRIVTNAVVTNIADSNIVKRVDSGEQSVKIDVSGDFPVSRLREVKIARQDIAETTNLLDIAFCNDAQCDGACGAQQDAGESGFTVGAAPAGSPGADADVWATANAGLAWTNSTPGSTHPFAAGLDIVSAVCFDVDKSTKRQLVARETVGGSPAQIAYSDDGWTTRTQVTVGAVNTECAAGHGALFALDKYHIWFATSEGNVYKSIDGGATWELTGAASASGGESLKYIHFATADAGVAVGDNGTIIATTDGGENWTTVTDPTSGDDLTAVFVWSQNRFVIGSAVGELLQTWDGGENFTDQSGYTGFAATNTVKDIVFVNDVVGYMIADTSAPVGKVYRSVDGGNDWKLLTTPTNAGLNALAVIDENLAYVAGNAQGGSGFVAKISG